MERFRFNPETLSYQKVEPKARVKLLRALASTGLVLAISVTVLFLRDTHIQTPRYETLSAEQQQIIYELDLMNRDIMQYEKELSQVAFNDDRIYRVYFEVDPWSSSMRNAGVGGSNKYGWLQQYKYADLLERSYQNIDQIERKLVIQSTSFDEVIEMAWTKEERMAARPAIQPLSMKDLVRFGSSFGVRMHPILKVVRPHEGIDLTAARGTNIYATADGKVIQAGYRAGGLEKKCSSITVLVTAPSMAIAMRCWWSRDKW
jgi:hypothetical protein